MMARWRGHGCCVVVLGCLLALVGCGGQSGAGVDGIEVPEDVVARVVVFGASDCPICDELGDTLIDPLQARCGSALALKYVDVGTAEGYEAFVATETMVVGEPGRWDVPTAVVEDVAFVGEKSIRGGLLDHLKCVFGDGGSDWPAVEALDAIAAAPTPTADAANPFGAAAGESIESCVDDEASEVCATGAPVFALYLSGAQCDDSCERTRYDLTYLKGVFPQLSFEERAIEDNARLAEALAQELSVPQSQRQLAPAVVVGEDYLVGDDLLLTNLRERIAAYAESGATALWYLIEVD